MKKIIAVLTISILMVACSSKKDGNMIVEGNIKGLKKGTLYLQKMNDTAIVSIDSVKVLGDGNFRLTDNVDSPVMYYLTFDGNSNDKRILFFGNEGTITIKVNEDNYYSYITISDNGPGLPPKAHKNIFKPFLGSIRAGGTGLGLAISAELITNHLGSLKLLSSTEEGTEFQIILLRK